MRKLKCYHLPTNLLNNIGNVLGRVQWFSEFVDWKTHVCEIKRKQRKYCMKIIDDQRVWVYMRFPYKKRQFLQIFA